MYSRWDFKEVFEDGAVDVIQPDVSHAGGITEMKKIAAMAEAYDVAMAPHCPLGPIALASCLQVDACSPNAFIQEQSLNIHYNETSDVLDYLADPSVFDYEDGYVQIPDTPGLGIEIDEEHVRAQAEQDVDWHNPCGDTPTGASPSGKRPIAVPAGSFAGSFTEVLCRNPSQRSSADGDYLARASPVCVCHRATQPRTPSRTDTRTPSPSSPDQHAGSERVSPVVLPPRGLPSW